MTPLLHVVLHEPEIPNNTGNIGRTCVAVHAALHLIHPLGFELSEKACRRAGLDYWPRLEHHEHASMGAYAGANPDARVWAFSAKASAPVWRASFRAGDHLLFGKETAGLPDEVLERHRERLVCLPMAPGERSLNLATAACTVAYEAVRQLVGRGEAEIDGAGRLVSPGGGGEAIHSGRRERPRRTESRSPSE